MRITVDIPACQAYGLCVMEAADYFEIDEEADKVAVLKVEVSDADEGIVEAAQRACPVVAIRLERA